EVNKSASLAIQGDFSYLIDTGDSEGFMLELAQGMNDICQISNQGLSEIKESIVALSQGDLSKRIKGDYHGEFLEIKTSFNNTLNQLSIIMDDIKDDVRQISLGDFSSVIETEDKQGFLLELASGINSLNMVLDRSLGEFQNSMEQLSKGNLNEPIAGEYAGKFDEMKLAVNNTLDQLKTVLNEIKNSANEISEGNFMCRIAVNNKEGFLLELGQSINDISEISNIGLHEIGNALRALSHGRLDRTIVNEYEGTFAEVKDLFNETIMNLRVVVAEIQTAADAVKNGDFSVRIDTKGKEGFLLDLSESLNEIGHTSSQGLNDVNEVLSNLFDGSLVHQMEGEYKGTFNDIKQTINATILQLKDMVLKIKNAAHSVNNASSEISEGSRDLSRRTEIQASTLEETSAATEELKNIVRTNTESALDANDKASEARNIATAGDEIIGNTVDAMSRIQESSTKVTDIIGVIDEIAFQTNLLALNAAVEAARAGEAGKGFAVVASEVRNLAGRSSAASKEIKDLINLSVEEVKNGSDMVRESGETLNNIIESVNTVADLIDKIASASQNQSQGISEVSQAITDIDATTQKNAALVEESTASSESMNDQAQMLLELTDFFKVDEDEYKSSTG
ncbi:MAG: methyl-accepting chemotaxis protein, partial [Rickettsiales bacterium]|nr:methyl-accepting chemotaxis protein [Rickettsiales bacterium]